MSYPATGSSPLHSSMGMSSASMIHPSQAYSHTASGLSASQQQPPSGQLSARSCPPPPQSAGMRPMGYPGAGPSPLHSSMGMSGASMIPPSQMGANVGLSSAPGSRYPPTQHQQYFGYNIGQGYGDNSPQARLLPYAMGAGPNSPGYRPAFATGPANIPAMSPRPPTATPPSHLSTDVPPSYPSSQAYSHTAPGLSASQQQPPSGQLTARSCPPPQSSGMRQRPFSPMSYPGTGSSPLHSPMGMSGASMISPSQMGANVGLPTGPGSSYLPSQHQQYFGYNLGQGYGDNSTQARLSPYAMGASPNSPGYRPAFGAGGANIPSMSPRPPTASHISTEVPPSYPPSQAYSHSASGLSASQQQSPAGQLSARSCPPPPQSANMRQRPFSPMSYPPTGSSPLHSTMGSSTSSMIPPSQIGANVGLPSAPGSNYTPSQHQQYFSYNIAQGYGENTSQARLSPYATNAGPNSPGFRPAFGTGGANIPAMSPRRPTATPPSMPPTSRTPDRGGSGSTPGLSSGPQGGYPSPSAGQLTSPNNQGVSPGNSGTSSGPSSGSSSTHPTSHTSSSSHSHSTHGPLSSHGSHPPPTNSLQQLEQMVMPHLNSPAPPNKINSISSIIASSSNSAPSNSYYNSVSGQQQQSQISSQTQLPPTMYPRFPSPSGTSPGSGNYYSGYHQQNSPSLWQNASNAPPSSSAATSSSNTHSPITSTVAPSYSPAAVSSYSPAAAPSYSPAAQINEQQTSQKQDVTSPGISNASMSQKKESESEEKSLMESSEGLKNLENVSQQNQQMDEPSMVESNNTISEGDLFADSAVKPPSRPHSGWGYGTSYNDSYDPMGMSSDGGMSQMNTQPYMSHEQMMYDQNYGQNQGMGSMMRPQMNTGGFSAGPMGGEMGQMAPTNDPYDEYNFQQQEQEQDPPTNKKGATRKGRPKKDPNEPKREKKPRAPRTPKTASGRGRGRGGRSSVESHMSPVPMSSPLHAGSGHPRQPSMPSSSMAPGYEQNYGGDYSDMYSSMMTGSIPGPGGEMGMDPSQAMSYPPPQAQSSSIDQSQIPGTQSKDMYSPVQVHTQMPPSQQPPPSHSVPPQHLSPSSQGIPNESMYSESKSDASYPSATPSLGHFDSHSAQPTDSSTADESLGSHLTQQAQPPQPPQSHSSLDNYSQNQVISQQFNSASNSSENKLNELPRIIEDNIENTQSSDTLAVSSIAGLNEDAIFSTNADENTTIAVPSENQTDQNEMPASPSDSSNTQNYPSQTIPVSDPAFIQATPSEVPTTLLSSSSMLPIPVNDGSAFDEVNNLDFSEVQAPNTSTVKRKAKKRKQKDTETLGDDMNVLEAVECGENVQQSPEKKKRRVRKKKKADEHLNDADKSEANEETESSDKPKKKKKKIKKKEVEVEVEVEEASVIEPVDGSENLENVSQSNPPEEDSAIVDGNTTISDGDLFAESAVKPSKKMRKPRKPRLKEVISKNKKKLPKLALKFGKKKKRKRLGSSDNSDVDKTPPPSPEDGENGVLKRRSARVTKRQKYTDDIELDISEDDSNQGQNKLINDDKGVITDGIRISNTNVLVTKLNEDTMVVEKIMSSRIGEREIEPEGEGDGGEIDKPQTIKIEEYYVKYKNLSYLHCEWKTEEELEKGDKRINQKLKRFKQKKEGGIMFDFLDDEPFNPDYTEVDRILDVTEIEEVIEDDHSTGIKAQESQKPKDDVLCEENKPEMTEPCTEALTEKQETEDKTLQTPATAESPNSDQSNTLDQSANDTDPANPNDNPLPKVNSPEPEKELTNDTPAIETNDPKFASEAMDTSNDEIKPSELEDQSIKAQENILLLTSEKHEDPENQVDQTIDQSLDVFKNDNKEDDKKDDKKDDKEDDKEDDKKDDKKDEEKPTKTRVVRHFLVKWRGLPYEESTWELEDDLDPQKIAHFWRFKNPPPRDKWKPKKRPKASEWKKLVESPQYNAQNTLREYQLEGVNWLMFCWHNGRNCILADEMGLGKTIQSIAFVQEMVKHGIQGPFLVIAPLSTIGNWQREFETWTDLNVITYHGSSASRNMLQEYEMYYKKENGERLEGVYKFQVMITTFEIVLTDCLELREISWRCCIIDEAHRLKNRNCKLLEGLRLLDMEHRVLLTGTPLQNNVEELFSLLNFLEPAQFSSSDVFMKEFGELRTEDQVEKLKALLKPMMLRRLKEDVEKSLAPKEETIIEVELTNVQKKYYRAILERNFQFLTKGNTSANIPNLMNTMMELRKCCIHPFLINGAEEQIIHEYKTQKPDSPTVQLDALVQASGKLVLIDKLLPRLKADGHRVLVFSQMVRCLDILEDYLCQKRYPFERIDGRVRGNMRQAAIDRFSKPDSDRFVFLLCTRAGGLGINLTAADTVIIFDSDWNPQNDLQAQARCHRIGQSKMVKVYRLICRNTYEREMFDKASLKLGLDRAVLQSMNAQKNTSVMDTGMSKKEVEDLLRKGAYGAIMDDDNAGDKFCEEDIEQILQRRTHVITIESEQKGSTFSKASFAASDNRSDIEIDDPNFWEKWAKKAQLDVDELKGRNELIVQEPRKRTQTKRFGQDDSLLEISEVDSSDEDDENVSGRTRGGKGRIKLKKGKRGRADRDDDFLEEFAPGNWTKAECYQVEKGLLCYGWGRWKEFIEIGHFRRMLTARDVEDVARVIVLHCLQNCRGDDRRREITFFWEIITPNSQNGDSKTPKVSIDDAELSPGHGRRGRKRARKELQPEEATVPIPNTEWSKEDVFNPDLLLREDYRNHLSKIANKILLRIKLLYYLKHEIFGSFCDQITNGISCREASFSPPIHDGYPGMPDWWDEDADKSLLMGVYKHGYDRYNLMRQDPALCFLSRCGPPDGAAVLAELHSTDDLVKSLEEEEPDTPSTPSSIDVPESKPESLKEHELKNKEAPGDGKLPFPTSSDLNRRFRTLITAYQRNVKKQERLEKLERFEAAVREKENRRREQAQRRWSKREEADFFRTITSFGVEYIREEKRYDWSRFRVLSKLDRKMDESLIEYYKAFYAMCKKVTGRPLTIEEENLPYSVDLITEERASRALSRIDLLNKIREEILPHPELDERLTLCQSSIDLPDWWICGQHDRDLLIGAAKYGLNRLDFHLMHDKDLSFMNIFRVDEAELKNRSDKLISRKVDNEADIKNSVFKEMTSTEDENQKDIKPITGEMSDSIALESIVKKEIEHFDEKSQEGLKLEERKPLSSIKSFNVAVSGCPSDDAPDSDQAAKSEKQISNYETDPHSVDVSSDKLVPKPKDDVETDDDGTKEEEKIVKKLLDKLDEQEARENAERLRLEAEKATSKSEKTDEQSSSDSKEEKEGHEREENQEANNSSEKAIELKDNSTAEKENAGPVLASKNTDKSDSEKDKPCDLGGVNLENKSTKNFDLIKKDEDEAFMKEEKNDKASLILPNTSGVENDISCPTMNSAGAHLLTRGVVRWPKDRVLQIRLEQICYCVEKNEWPSPRQTFLTGVSGTVSSSTPSVATAESSPRAASPGSISSISREPTPHQTPDNTPRRESISPSPDFLYNHGENAQISSESKRSNRGRRRRRYDIESSDRAKLRNLLSQAEPITSSKKPLHPPNSSNSMMQGNSSFLPPLFSLAFGANFRSDRGDLTDDKGASLLLGSASSLNSKGPPFSLSSSAINSSPILNPGVKGSLLSKSGEPPPAHQNLSQRSTKPLDNLDLTFPKSRSSHPLVRPATTHKPLPPPTKPVEKPSSSPPSILDLSSGPTSKKDRESSKSLPSTNQTLQASNASRGKIGKRIGSRIDDLAFTLRQKKMMQEKHDDPHGKETQEHTHTAPRELKARSELDKVETRNSTVLRDHIRTPPAAHSSSLSSSLSSALIGCPPKISDKPGLFTPKGMHTNTKEPSHSSHHPPSETTSKSSIQPKLDLSMADHTAAWKKLIEAHPDLLNSQTFANALLNSNPSIPANTQLLELPDSRRRGRRPKTESTLLAGLHGLTGNESVPVINRATGKKQTGSKAPTFKNLSEWLEKNPSFEVDPKWASMMREKFPSLNPQFKTPPPSASLSATSSIRTRTSDRRLSDSSAGSNNSQTSHHGSGSSRRSTAASLLAQSGSNQNNSSPTSSATSSATTSSSFGFPSPALNPLALNPNLLSSFPSMKMFLEPGGLGSGATSSASRSSSSGASTSTTSTAGANANTPMYFPFGGLGLGNPLLFPGFNIPGLGPGFNSLSMSGLTGESGGTGSTSNTKKDKDHHTSSSSGHEKQKGSEKSSSASGSGSSKSKNSNRNLQGSASSMYNSAAATLPFLYPNPSFLYSPLNLGGFSLSSSPFASLAQSSLMNGIGGLVSSSLGSSTPTTTLSSSSSAQNVSSQSKSSKSGHSSESSKPAQGQSKNLASSSNARGSASAGSSLLSVQSGLGLSAAAAASLMSASGQNVTNPLASSMSTLSGMGDSDDDSLKSLMGQEDDEDDLNGELDDINENVDTDSDYEATLRSKSKSKSPSTKSSSEPRRETRKSSSKPGDNSKS